MNKQKPIIGISSSVIVDTNGNFAGYERSYVNKDYVDSVIKNGGIPVIIPFNTDVEVTCAQMELIDGLILSGGHDVDPLNYNQEPLPKLGETFPQRDKHDFLLLKIAKQKNIPVLGICRGFQVINVYEGGSLFQDLSYAKKELLKHNQEKGPCRLTHSVLIKENSKMYEIFQEDEILVNSFHHQIIDKVASGYEITAEAKDGVIEAIESKNHKFIVGVQWHPEMLFKVCDNMNNLFKRFIEESNKQ